MLSQEYALISKGLIDNEFAQKIVFSLESRAYSAEIQAEEGQFQLINDGGIDEGEKKTTKSRSFQKKLGSEITCRSVRAGVFGNEGLAQKRDSRFEISRGWHLFI